MLKPGPSLKSRGQLASLCFDSHNNSSIRGPFTPKETSCNSQGGAKTTSSQLSETTYTNVIRNAFEPARAFARTPELRRQPFDARYLLFPISAYFCRRACCCPTKRFLEVTRRIRILREGVWCPQSLREQRCRCCPHKMLHPQLQLRTCSKKSSLRASLSVSTSLMTTKKEGKKNT